MKNRLEPNLNHLKYLITAVESGSLLEAARIHRVSQPAISLAFKKLEEAFEIQILVHLRNRFKLTPEGEKLYHYGVRLFKEMEEVRHELSDHDFSLKGELKIATTMGVGPLKLNRSLAKFLDTEEGVHLKMSFGDLKTIYQDLKNNKVELAIIMEDRPHKEFERKVLFEGSFVPVVNSRSNNRNKIFLTMDSPGVIDFKKISQKKKIKLDDFSVNEIDNWEMIIEMVKLGAGIGIIPDFMRSNEMKIFDELLTVTRMMKYKVVLYHKGEHQLSKVAEKFLKEI